MTQEQTHDPVQVLLVQILQPLFDRAVGGIIAQGGPSIGPDKMCLYRAPNGRRCAAGQLIADEHYRPEFEGKGIKNDEVFDAISRSTKLPDDYWVKSFFGALQGTHDLAARDKSDPADRTTKEFITLFKANAQAVAENFGLEFRF